MLWTREQVEQSARQGTAILQQDGHSFARVLDRTWICCDPRDQSVAPHLLNQGFWEAWITAWFLNQLSETTAVIDVGANQGYYAALAASAGCPVIALEPQPELVRLLSRTKRKNAYREFIVVEAAAGAMGGQTTLYVPEHLLGGASIIGDPLAGQSRAVSVQVVPLDAFVRWQASKTLLIKIDAEGAEPLVLRGMQDLWATRSCTVLMEWTWGNYTDPVTFALSLFAMGNVSIMDYCGTLRRVTSPDELRANDWITVVIQQRQ